MIDDCAESFFWKRWIEWNVSASRFQCAQHRRNHWRAVIKKKRDPRVIIQTQTHYSLRDSRRDQIEIGISPFVIISPYRQLRRVLSYLRFKTTCNRLFDICLSKFNEFIG